MQDLIKIILISLALFGIGWFVSFQYDPYRVCVDHPEKALKKDFYLCEPGGFTLQKGTRLERPDEDRFPWEKHGDVIIGTENPRKRYKKEESEMKNNLESFNCRPEFYELSDSEVLRLSPQQVNYYCTPKGQKTRPIKNNSLEQLPDNGTKDL